MELPRKIPREDDAVCTKGKMLRKRSTIVLDYAIFQYNSGPFAMEAVRLYYKDVVFCQLLFVHSKANDLAMF